MSFLRITMCVLSLCFTTVYGQPDDLTHYGRSFVLSYPRGFGQLTGGLDAWILYVSNLQPATAKFQMSLIQQDGSEKEKVVYLVGQRSRVVVGYKDDECGFLDNGIFPCTLFITSTGPVSVIATVKGTNSSSFHAVPISHFGTSYVLVTMPGNPLFNVVSAYDWTDVSVVFKEVKLTEVKIAKFHEFSVEYNGKTHGPGETLYIYLEHKYNAFQFHDCRVPPFKPKDTDFTGSEVKATKPVGVISGNCFSAITNNSLDKARATAMLVPTNVWGQKFVFMTTSSGFVRVNLLGITKATVTLKPTGLVEEHWVTSWENCGLSTDIKFKTGEAFIETSQPVQITVLYGSNWLTPSVGGILPVVAMENWLNRYIVPRLHPKTWLMIYCLYNHRHGFILDGKSLQVPPHALSDQRFMVLIEQISFQNMYVDFEVRHERAVRFGLVIFTQNILSAGTAFYSVDRNVQSCVKSHGYNAEDEIDNDCDGLIDEEIFDLIDDDGDGRVDEDLAAVHGGWSEWSDEVTCSVRCRGEGVMGYHRECNNPPRSRSGNNCVGDSFKPASPNDSAPCDTGSVKCPDECERGEWYFGCVYTCSPGCLKQCDLLTGDCNPCDRHYIQTDSANCSEEAERTFLEDVEPYMVPLAILGIEAIVIVCCCFVCGLRKMRQKRRRQYSKYYRQIERQMTAPVRGHSESSEDESGDEDRHTEKMTTSPTRTTRTGLSARSTKPSSGVTAL